MKTDTPRTDGEQEHIENEHNNYVCSVRNRTEHYVVSADFCRQLERDLNSVVNQWSSDVDRMEKELAKARERIAELEKKT